jgi:hypothetical protein
MKEAMKQSKGSDITKWKTFDCRHVVTVAHGTATLAEVMAAVEAYYERLGPNTARQEHTLELTIVHLDSNEYQEHDLPNHWTRRDSS